MFREQARASQGLLLLMDVVSLCLAFGLAVALRAFHESIPLLRDLLGTSWNVEKAIRSEYALLLIASGLGWIVSLKRSGIYEPGRSHSLIAAVQIYIKAALHALLISGATVFTLKIFSISRLFFAYYFATALVLLPAGRAAGIKLLMRLRRDGSDRRCALLIGAGQPIAWFSKAVLSAGSMGYDFVGVLLMRRSSARYTSDLPILGSIENLDAVLRRRSIDHVFLVGGAREIAKLAPTAQRLIERGCVVSLVSPIASGVHGVAGRITDFSGIPAISFGPVPEDPISKRLKRCVDVVGAGAALALAGPLMIGVAALIKLFDPGPIFFRQERLGLNGKTFVMYKFRSMRVDAEAQLRRDRALYMKYLRNDHKLRESEDPRISALGRILRKTSVDELPQFWNVLKGEMCLVGPRPITPQQIDSYGAYARLLLSVRPGITGSWQVHGRSQIHYPERAFLDLDYVGNHSVSGDMSILANTLPSVIKHARAPGD